MPSSTNRFYLKSDLRSKDPESALLRAELVFRDLVNQLNKAKVAIVVLPGEALPSGMLYGQPVIDIRSGYPVLQFWDGANLINAGESVANFPDLNDVPNSYTGNGGKVVSVKAGEDGLEFTTASSVDEFTDLNDTPSSLSGQSLKLVRVNSGETALEFWTLALAFLGLSDTPSSFSGAGNYLVRVNAGETALEFVAPSAGGVSSFTDLDDVPTSYTGHSLKVVRVNSGETALEFATVGGAESFTDLDDVPSSFSGEGGKLLAVNSGETALEFVDAPSRLVVIAKKSSTSSLSAGGNAVTFGNVIRDTLSETSTSGGYTRWTPSIAGDVLIQANLFHDGGWTTSYISACVIRKNGSTLQAKSNYIGPGVSCSLIDSANGSTDYYEILFYVNGSGRTAQTPCMLMCSYL